MRQSGKSVTWTNQKLSGRIPELDGIRGLAILLVLVLHYAVEPGILYVERDWQVRTLMCFRLSWSGVDLFFVLSGFLIGGILLDAKYADDYYRTFYLRRFYRIVPLYALLILILGACPRIANLEGCTGALRVARISGGTGAASARSTHFAHRVFSKANLTQNDAPSFVAAAMCAY